MNRKLADRAKKAADALADGVQEGDPASIQAARDLLRELALDDDEQTQQNILWASRMQLLGWSQGPLDDLLLGLSQAQKLAKRVLEYDDDCEGRD